MKKFVWTKAADRVLRTNSPLAAAEMLKLSKRTINRRRRVLKLTNWGRET